MERWHDLTAVAAAGGMARSVVTIGVFDGVHRGHQRVVAHTIERAQAERASAVVVTFDPHPMAVVRPEVAPRLLTTLDQRLEVFAGLGVDASVVLPFTRQRSQQPAEEFVAELANVLRPVAIVVGADFRFGFKAAGDVELLMRLGRELGFTVTSLERQTTDDQDGQDGQDGQDWSSTNVRHALAAGDVRRAWELLGRPFRVDGAVVHGDHRGRTLGVPTANVPGSADLALPSDGVYAGWLIDHSVASAESAEEAERWPAVVSIGTKPQFGYSDRVLEAHVLDRGDLDLYDHQVSIEFAGWIRGQEKFASVDLLIERMRQDITEARTTVRMQLPD